MKHLVPLAQEERGRGNQPKDIMPPKRLLSIIPLAALFLVASCKTTGGPDIERISVAVKEAATIGTQEAIRDHPEWIPTFVLVRDQLDAISVKDRITVSDLLAAINKLPVSELSSDTARLSIEAARLLVAIAGWSDVEIVQTGQIRPVIIAMSQGITAGLGRSATKSGPKKHYKAK